jgi:hypothetical protein
MKKYIYSSLMLFVFLLNGNPICQAASINYNIAPESPETLLGEYFELTLISNPGSAGILSGGGVYLTGEEVFISATPNENYIFKNWTLGETEVSAEPNFSYTMFNQNITFHANFYIMGDVNNDGIINIADLTMLIDFILGNNPVGFLEFLADLNRDLSINVIDVVFLIHLL